MTQRTYGLVGVPDTTVTMITTLDEDDRLTINDSGDKLPDDVITKRLRNFDQTRANRQSRQAYGDDQVAARMFPTEG